MNIALAHQLFFTRAFDFKGRSSREEFWYGVFPNAVIMLVLTGLLLYGLLGFGSIINVFSILMIVLLSVFCAVELIPSLALMTRRMHDIGKSGKYIAVLLIPVAGYVWYLYLVTRPTDFYAENR